MPANPRNNRPFENPNSRRLFSRSGVIFMIAFFHSALSQCRPYAGGSAPPRPSTTTTPTTVSPAGLPRTTERQVERQRMVEQQMTARDIRDPRVLDAMRSVPRHWFVPEESTRSAYDDRPLPIGWDQTISQPYIVALMTQLLALKRGEKVLEIGTGSGYQAAVLAELTDQVYTIEIVEPLAKRTIEILRDRGYANIHVRIGDGYLGWPDEAPFDAIIVTCAPEDPPPALIAQLAPGGRMCIPVGSLWTGQELILMRKEKDGTLKKESVAPVQFVPMTGKAQEK